MQGESIMKNKNRTKWLTAFLLFVLAPLTIWAGVFFLDDRKYYFISFLLIVYAILPFFVAFEKRKPQAAELLLVAVLTAIAVAGRAAFFMLPQMKPVVAIVIIAGLCFGREIGFLTGSLTAFISNFFFGQGPFVPWQMFAIGLIGFLAGVLAEKGVLKKTGRSAACFGGLSVFFLYGAIMDLCSVFMWTDQISWELLAATFAAGFLFNLIHAAATVVFLLLLTRPLCEKLERVKVKYGLLGFSE